MQQVKGNKKRTHIIEALERRMNSVDVRADHAEQAILQLEKTSHRTCLVAHGLQSTLEGRRLTEEEREHFQGYRKWKMERGEPIVPWKYPFVL